MVEYVGTLIYDKENNSILFVENNKTGKLSLWGFPAGTVENETILEAAIRETKEEVDLEVNLTENNFIGKFEGTLEYKEGKFYVYFYGTKKFEGIPKAKSDALQIKWFKVNDILKNQEEEFFISNGEKYLLRDNVKKAIVSYFEK